MAKVKAVMSGAFTLYGHKFICPGCDHPVVLPTSKEATGHAWGFNGDLDAPVFTPSVLQKWSCWSPERRKLADLFKEEHGRWPTREELPDDEHHVCHSFVGCNGAAPGQIIFLPDSTHKLSGQVVDLPDVESDWGNRDD
jgi:hypothetical protein